MKKAVKKSAVKKMMTGGKANPNASVAVQKVPGSLKGTMVDLNKAATVESSAGNPKLSYKKGGSVKTKMMYGGTKMMKGGMKKMGKKK